MKKPQKLTVLDHAREAVFSERNKTYGHPAANFKTTADFWNAYLRQRAAASGVELSYEVQPKDVAHMMGLLKYARLANDPNHHDSIVDVAGYAATAERCDE